MIATIIFVGLTVFCACKWFINYLAASVLVYYMKQKGYIPPNDEEVKEYTREFVKKELFKVSD